MISSKATFYGIAAIFIWSTFTALIRMLTESFGVTGGAALMYSVGAIFLCLKSGVPSIRKFPKAYLLFCGPLLVIYEVLLSQAIGLAATRQQSIEVSLVNYLWPCLVVLFAVFLNKQRVNYLFLPGIALSFIGVAWAISGENGFDLTGFVGRIRGDPIPYSLALVAALFWGLYCNLSKRFNNGNNGIPLFFIVVAILLWIKFFCGTEKILNVSFASIAQVLMVGVLIACSYAFWEVGIQKGNMLLLAVLSYFTPVFSVLFSAWWLHTPLTLSFGYGVAMVTVGSLLCWLATRNKKLPVS